MRIVNKKLIMSVVVLFCFSLLSTGLMQPIQTVNAMETRSAQWNDVEQTLTLIDTPLVITQMSEGVVIVSMGEVSVTVEFLENCQRLSTVSADGEILMYEITIESKSFETIVRVNGTESKVLMNQFMSSSSIEYPKELPNSRGSINYWWDRIYFWEETGFWQFLTYPHPDKIYNDIDPDYSWGAIGHELIHFQLDRSSSELTQYYNQNPVLAAIALALNAFGYDTFLYDVASIIGDIIALSMSILLTDEGGNIWFWVGWNGYFRIGPITLRDDVNFGNPEPPSQYYATSAASSSTGNGYVNNENNILGAVDGSYAYLSSGSYLNKAEISVFLSYPPISGQLYLRCYTPSANGANLKVFVCDDVGWRPVPVVNTNLYPANSVITVNCGYVYDIVCVSIVAYHEYSGYPSYIYVDATWLVP